MQEQKYDGPEPYMGVTSDSRFELATATDLPKEMTLDRLDRRRSLLDQFDIARREPCRAEADGEQFGSLRRATDRMLCVRLHELTKNVPA